MFKNINLGNFFIGIIMNISDRISSRMKELKLKNKDLTSATGASKGTVSQWVSGGNRPSAIYIPKLAQILNVSETWLINGGNYSQRSNTKEVGYRALQKIPLISLSQAGKWRTLMNSKNEFLEWTTVSDDISPHAFSVKMDNDSMTSDTGPISITEGSVIIFDPEKTPQSGQVVLAIIGDSAVIKKLIIDGPSAYLTPIKAGYKTIELESLSQIIATGVSVQIKLP